MVVFKLRRPKKGLSDLFRPSIEISFGCKETLLSRLGISRGYKSRIKSDERLAEEGEAARIAEILSDQGGKRIRDGYPLQLPIERLRELQGYEIRIFGKWRTINDRAIKVLDAIYDYVNIHSSTDTFDEEDMIKYLTSRLGHLLPLE